MRILHLVPSVHPTYGGLAALSLGFAEAQRALGHAPTLWCTDSERRLREARSVHGFPADLVRRFGAVPWLGLTPAMERAALSEGDRFAVVHQHGIWPMLSRVTNRWREKSGRPSIIAPQGSLEVPALRRSRWKKRLALATYQGRNLELASCLQANSEAEASTFRTFGLKQPIAIIPNAFPDAWLDATGDAERFRARHRLPVNRRLALFIGRIHPIKGIALLVEAVARLDGKLDDWLFVLAGPEEHGHGREIRELAQRLGVGDRFRFVGALYREDKRDAYAAAEVFVLPSLSESFGITVAEALGAGVPALTTHGAPWAELETHECGWWVETSADGVARGLEVVLSCSAARLQEMGLRGRERVARRYTWSQVGAQAVELYEWLCGIREQPDFVQLD